MADTQTDDVDPDELDTAIHRVIMPIANSLDRIAGALDRIARELSALTYRS
jgi:hypothetical protein